MNNNQWHRPSNKKKVMSLNGHSCLNCNEGWYDGYILADGTTRPCQVCGDVRPTSMKVSEFLKLVEQRDAKLYGVAK